MSIATIHGTITVWTEYGIPARIVWGGTRYRVTDRPTELLEDVSHPFMTHPLERLVGWRFQGTDDAGESRVFDARPREGQLWDLLRVWE